MNRQEVSSYLQHISEALNSMKMSSDYKFRGSEELVLKHGKFFHPNKLPTHIAIGVRGKCYSNAFELMSSHPASLTYVEGYACYPKLIIPVLHAWCVTKEGFVRDTTWEYSPDAVYYGIPFKRSFVTECALDTKWYSIFDNMKICGQLLTGKTDINKVMTTLKIKEVAC